MFKELNANAFFSEGRNARSEFFSRENAYGRYAADTLGGALCFKSKGTPFYSWVNCDRTLGAVDHFHRGNLTKSYNFLWDPEYKRLKQ